MIKLENRYCCNCGSSDDLCGVGNCDGHGRKTSKTFYYCANSQRCFDKAIKLLENPFSRFSPINIDSYFHINIPLKDKEEEGLFKKIMKFLSTIILRNIK